MNLTMQLPGYKCKLRDVVCESGMGEGQESEMFTKKIRYNSHLSFFPFTLAL